MNQPIRIQRRRVKGWRMPENTVYVGRGSTLGNPYKIGELIETDIMGGGTFVKITPAIAVELFEKWAIQKLAEPDNERARAALRGLRGKNLACFCRLDQPCHADVLLKLANTPVCEEV